MAAHPKHPKPPHLDDAAADLYDVAMLTLQALQARSTANMSHKPDDEQIAFRLEQLLRHAARDAIEKAWRGIH